MVAGQTEPIFISELEHYGSNKTKRAISAGFYRARTGGHWSMAK